MDAHYLNLLDVSERIRRREFTSEAVTEALLARIAHHEPQLNSIILLLADSALAQARQADAEIERGAWRGPLHGIPIGVKDVVWTAGLPTTAASPILRDFRPTEDATIVKRLKQAGAVLIAKLTMTEFATFLHHPDLPRPVNPWSASHWTGVSSSGSGVAPAAGFCFGAIGTDTGGSIRLPCAANNLSGIKPTWGRVSRHGLIPLSESLDHLGPMARSVADAAAILQAIAGHDPDDPTSLSDPVPDYLGSMHGGVRGRVLGMDWPFAAAGMPEPIVVTLRRALDVFADLGMEVREFTFPWTDADLEAMKPIFPVEAAAAHAHNFPEKADQYGPWLRKMIEIGRASDPLELVRAQFAREAFKGRVRAALRDVDLMLFPGLGKLLPTWELMDALGAKGGLDRDLARYTSPFNLAGIPTLSFPGGFSEDGLPIGLQLAAPWGEEAALLRAGVAFQQVTDFHTRRPPLDD